MGTMIYKMQEELNHSGHILVSVIIPSRNSERTIAECLRSVISQSYKPIEVIVVDGFSTDSTRQIAESMGASFLSHRGERSVAKNLGANYAKGRYLYFVDADHRLDHNTIATCVMSMEGVDGLVITDQDLVTNSKISRLVAARRRILSYDPLNVALRFVTKDAFFRVGGFDEELFAGEDLDLHKRLLVHGFKLAYTRAIEWHLGSPTNLKGLWNRSKYYSSNYVRYASKNPLISIKRMSPVRVISAWKKSEAPRSGLLPVVLIGFLSNAFLMIGLVLNLAECSKIFRKKDA